MKFFLTAYSFALKSYKHLISITLIKFSVYHSPSVMLCSVRSYLSSPGHRLLKGTDSCLALSYINICWQEGESNNTIFFSHGHQVSFINSIEITTEYLIKDQVFTLLGVEK